MSPKPVLLLALLSLFISACGPKPLPGPTFTPTPALTSEPSATLAPTTTFTPAATPTPIVYDGEWSGTTSAGGTIRFTVINNELLAIRVNFGFSTKNASCNVDSNTTISPGLAMSENGYQITLPTLKITVVFDSPTTASGTLDAAEDSQHCEVSVTGLTWTAEKGQ